MRRVMALAAMLVVCLPISGRCQAVSDGSRTPMEIRHPFRWQVGDDIELLLRGFLAVDLLTYESSDERAVEIDLRRARLVPIVRGDWLTARFEVELASAEVRVQEAWFEVRPLDELMIRLGRLRVPFGYLQTTLLKEMLVFGRPLIAGSGKDARDVGMLLGGCVFGERLRYSLGVVTGSRGWTEGVERPDGVAWLEVAPLLGAGWWLEDLRLAAYATYGDGPLRNGFGARTNAGVPIVSAPRIGGVQWRWGAGLRLHHEIVRLTAELQSVRQDRQGVMQTVDGTEPMREYADLEPWEVRGAYLELGWHLFGLRSRRAPRTGLELAARIEHFEYGDGERLVDTDAGEEDHAPLPDSTVDGVAMGVNGYFEIPLPLRLSLVWQGAWTDDTGSMALSQQVLARAQLEL